MANTLTDLIPDIYEALDTVSREQVGFCRAVARNSSAERAALNETIRVPVTGSGQAADNTPGITPPDTGDQTIDNVQITINKSKHIPIRWNGEQTRGMQNAGIFGSTLQDQFAQAFRDLSNLVEADIAQCVASASRAYGTAGTTPFGTAGDLTDISRVGQILTDNGANGGTKRLVLSSAAVANLKGIQSGLFKVNEAGTADLLRRGIIGDLQGFGIGESAGISTHSAGTVTDTTVTGANAVGATEIGVTTAATTGAVSMVAGDIVTFAGDTNKYVVAAAVTIGAGATGTISIAKPGLRVATSGSEAISVVGNYTPSVAFQQSAIQLVTRAPAMPDGGDAAVDSVMVADPVSMITYEVAQYKLYLQNVYHVRLAWGYSVIKPQHVALLLG